MIARRADPAARAALDAELGPITIAAAELEDAAEPHSHRRLLVAIEDARRDAAAAGVDSPSPTTVDYARGAQARALQLRANARSKGAVVGVAPLADPAEDVGHGAYGEPRVVDGAVAAADTSMFDDLLQQFAVGAGTSAAEADEGVDDILAELSARAGAPAGSTADGDEPGNLDWLVDE